MAAPERNLEALLMEDRRFPPPPEFEAPANASDPAIYEAAAKDPLAFWESFARELEEAPRQRVWHLSPPRRALTRRRDSARAARWLRFRWAVRRCPERVWRPHLRQACLPAERRSEARLGSGQAGL